MQATTGRKARASQFLLPKLILLHDSRIRLVRLFKGESDLAVEQKGEPLGPHVKSEINGAREAEEETVMEE